jgi:hypothetical protein
LSKLSLSFQNCHRFHGVNATGRAVESNIGVDLVLSLERVLFRRQRQSTHAGDATFCS